MTKKDTGTSQAKTRHGGDADLKTANHDEIMVWLDTNMEKILQQILRHKPNWERRLITQLQAEARETVKSYQENQSGKTEPDASDFGYSYHREMMNWKGLANVPERPPLKIKKTWIYTIQPDPKKKFPGGYIDLRVVCQDNQISTHDIGKNRFLSTTEAPAWKVFETPHVIINFDVHSVLPALGELIRQIKMCQPFVNGLFYVVAPDDKYAKLLIEQGFGFVKYPEGYVTGYVIRDDYDFKPKGIRT